jgi:hypothetical protein
MDGLRRRIGLAVLAAAAAGLRLWVALVPAEPGTLPTALLQCAAGAGLVVAVAWLGWGLMPDRLGVGWLAALAAAVYPPHLQGLSQPGKAVWAALLLTALLAAAVTVGQSPSRLRTACVGLLAGLLLWVEPPLALAAPVCLAAFWSGQNEGGVGNLFAHRPLGRLALALGVLALVAGPWLVLRGTASARPRYVEAAIPGTGNGPAAAGTQPEGAAPTRAADGGASRPAAAAPDGPGRLARLRMLLVEPAAVAGGRATRVAAIAWLVLAGIGLSVSRGRWRDLWPSYAVFAVVLAACTLVWPSRAARMALEPLGFVWAAAGVWPLFGRTLPPRRRIRIYRPGQRAADPFEGPHVLPGPHFDLPERRKAG